MEQYPHDEESLSKGLHFSSNKGPCSFDREFIEDEGVETSSKEPPSHKLKFSVNFHPESPFFLLSHIFVNVSLVLQDFFKMLKKKIDIEFCCKIYVNTHQYYEVFFVIEA
jgi:hypothetical protein